MKEFRLLGRTLKTINKQRLDAGVTPLVTPVGTTPRSAQMNAAQQISVPTAPHPISTLSSPQYIEIPGVGGYDTREWTPTLDESGNVVGVTPKKIARTVVPESAPAGWVDVSGLSPYSGEGHAGVAETPQQFEQRKAAIEQKNAALLQQQQLKQKEAQDIATRQAANSAASSAASQTKPFQPFGNRISAEGKKANFDAQSFIEEKRAEGVSDFEIRRLLREMPKPVDTPITPPPSPTVAPQETKAPDAAPSAPTSPAKPTGAPTTTKGTPQAPVPNRNANVLRQLAALETDPLMQISLNAAADQLDAIGPPEDPMGQAEFNRTGDARAISSPYDAINKILERAETTAKNSENSRKAFLEGQLARTESYNALREEGILNQLSYTRDKAARDLADANKKRLDSQTIILALQGGFGSADGNAEIAEARLKGEQAIADLNKEYGFKKTDVSLAFTQMHNDAYDKYQTSWLEATDNFENKIANLQLQGISNQQAKGTALRTAYKDYVSEIKDSRKEYAKTVQDATKMVSDAHNAQRNADRLYEQQGWQRLEWAVGTYGSDIPQGVLDSIQKSLPKGMDISSILSSPTLEQMRMRKASGGSGGGGLSFSLSERNVNGEPLGLEAWMAQREKDWHSLGEAGPASPQQRALWTKEYNAKLAQDALLSPVQIHSDLTKKAAFFPNVNSYKVAAKEVERMLSNGEYDTARKYVDSLGKPLSDTASKGYKALTILRNSLPEMERLLEQIQDRIGPFPTQGPLWSWMSTHIASDPDYQSLITLKGTLASQYARGVSGEVGVLTDQDIQRAAAGMLDPNVSYAAMRAGLDTSKKLIDIAIQSNLQIDRANGRAVSDLEADLNAPIGDPSLDSSQEGWLNNL